MSANWKWATAAVAVCLLASPLSAQPARTLSPDELDAPAATSVADAQRAAEMAGGGHAAHGGTYRHADVGRGPEARDEPGPHHHHHGAGEEEEEEAAAVYVCPMHPEVTSSEPGTCPKCGMALVERREE